MHSEMQMLMPMDVLVSMLTVIILVMQTSRLIGHLWIIGSRRFSNYNESMSSEGDQQYLLDCGLLPNSVLCDRSQSHSHLRGSVRIFGDPQMNPQMVSKLIYPRSTNVLVEPCGSQHLVCGSYVRLQQLRISSVFPVNLAIGLFAVCR